MTTVRRATRSLTSERQELDHSCHRQETKTSFFHCMILTGTACQTNRFMALYAKQKKPLGGWWKRLLDVLISASALLLLTPAILLTMCLIYFTMGRPIFFSHQRVGFRGGTFKCYKFRTMVNDAGQKLEIYLRDNPAAMMEWETCRKLKNDPRITPLGAILRKSSLDELPQLINIIRGEMTCVGPRPVTADELSRYRNSARYYLKVRPGLTGLWQVRGRSQTTFETRVALDRTYIVNWSMWLDIKILIKTIPAVLRFDQTA